MSVSISQVIDAFRARYGNSAAFTRLPNVEHAMTRDQVLRTLSRQYSNFYGLPREATDDNILRLVGHGYDFTELLRTIFRRVYGMQADVGAIDAFLRSRNSFALFQRRHQPENIREEQYAHQFVEGEDRRQYLADQRRQEREEEPGGGERVVFESRSAFRQGAERAPVPGIGANVNAGQNIRILIREPPRPDQTADRDDVIRSQHLQELKDAADISGPDPRRVSDEDPDSYDAQVERKNYVPSRDGPQNVGSGEGPQFGVRENPGSAEGNLEVEADRILLTHVAAPPLQQFVEPVVRHIAGPILHRAADYIVHPLVHHAAIGYPVIPYVPPHAHIPGRRVNLYDVAGLAIGGAANVIGYLGNQAKEYFDMDEPEKKELDKRQYQPSPAPPPTYPPSTPPAPAPRPSRGQGEPMENPYDRTPPTLPFGYAYYPQPFKHTPRIDRAYVGNYHLPVVGRHDFVKWTKYTENNALGSAY